MKSAISLHFQCQTPEIHSTIYSKISDRTWTINKPKTPREKPEALEIPPPQCWTPQRSWRSFWEVSMAHSQWNFSSFFSFRWLFIKMNRLYNDHFTVSGWGNTPNVSLYIFRDIYIYMYIYNNNIHRCIEMFEEWHQPVDNQLTICYASHSLDEWNRSFSKTSHSLGNS